jgi:antitoxin (DNA-binding transcriptional repressor) of toxin-antitoxin stability system
MKAVGIKVLKNKLSEYVRLAAAGETVLVTDRDRVVAQITAPDATRSPLLADAVLADAVRQGWLTPPVVGAGDPPPRPEPVATLSDLLAELDKDRGER